MAWNVINACEGAWNLNENAANSTVADVQGRYPGTAYANASTTNTSNLAGAGKLNGCFVFDGTTSEYHVRLGDVLNKAWNQAFSIEAWIKTTDAALETQIMCTAPSYGYRFEKDANRIVLVYVDAEGDYFYVRNETTVSDGAWHHAVATYNGGGANTDAEVYVDGSNASLTRVGTGVNSTGAVTSTCIGASYYTGGSVTGEWVGSIDNVRMYNRVLTAEEVTALYNAGTGTESLSSNYPPATTGEKLPTVATASAIGAWTDDVWTQSDAILTQGTGTADAAGVTAATFDDGDQTYVLKGKGFDFSGILAGSIIHGIVCRFEGWAVTSGATAVSCGLDYCRLLDTAGAEAGENWVSTGAGMGTTVWLSATTQIVCVGHSLNMWSNALTADWVKNANFGIALGFRAGANNLDLFIDYVTLEIVYTPPTAVTPLSLQYTFVEC